MSKEPAVLITGAAGFVGSWVLRFLPEKYGIVALRRPDTDMSRVEDIKDKAVWYDAGDDLAEIFSRHNIKGVIHLATCYRKTHTSQDIGDMIDSNVRFPTRLLEAACAYGAEFFINTGTFFEYGCEQNPMKISDEPKPFNLYASTKTAFENILRFYTSEYGLKTVTLKLFSPYGYKDNPKLVRFLIQKILAGENVELEKGGQKWDFIYVKDAARAFIKALQYADDKTEPGYDAFFIGTGVPRSVKEICEILNDYAGKDLISNEKDYAGKQIFLAYPDLTETEQKLGWRAEYSLEEGLSEAVEMYKNNGIEK